jgi:hypothetical protein
MTSGAYLNESYPLTALVSLFSDQCSASVVILPHQPVSVMPPASEAPTHSSQP